MRYEVSYEYLSYTYESEKGTINGFIQDYSRSNLVKNKEKHLVSNRTLRLKTVPTVSRSLSIQTVKEHMNVYNRLLKC